MGVVGGLVFLPALFFMDFKNAEGIEYEAYRQRYNHLSNLAQEKKCGVKREDYISIEEMKKEYNRLKEEKALKEKNNTKK